MVPKHVGLILDGNRRFAKRLMIKPWKGHEWGAKKVEKLFDWCKELGVKELTLYALSIENLTNRPKEELNFLMDIFRKEFDKLKNDERLEKDNVRIRFIGRLNLLPEDIQKTMKSIMDKTKKNNKFFVNFALAYGGRQEVIDAVKRLWRENIDVNKLNEEMFSKYLYLEGNPDIIIRTGGEKRTSNFLIWQGSYSELMFIDKLWPEFGKEDFVKCIEEFSKRERRFGK